MLGSQQTFVLTDVFPAGSILGMKDGDIIKALGGFKVVAPLLGVTDENARHMESRVIPWRYRRKVEAIAKRKKVKLPSDFLDVQRST